jgi:hypothetical protein
MKIIDTFVNHRGRRVRVKRGFSWPAFLLGPVWALFRGSGRAFLLMLAGYLPILAFDIFYIGNSTSLPLILVLLALYITYMIVCGICGNRWLADSLLESGYVCTQSPLA